MSSKSTASNIEISAALASLAAVVPWLSPILDRLEVGIAVMQGNRVEIANEGLAQILGFRAAALVGMPADCLVGHIVRRTNDAPDRLRTTTLLPWGCRSIVCEEFEIIGPARSVVRWVAQELDLPSGPAILIICTDVTVEVDQLAAQERLAVTDRLTGLMNRRGADHAMAREIARAQRFGTCLSLAVFDVDNFKSINDRCGHATGDRVLCLIGEVLTQHLRSIDVAVRWGGEEFLVLLPNTGLAGAQICAERIRAALSAIEIARLGRVTMSAGVAELSDGESLDRVLARVDENLYAAKAAGRDCVR